MLNLPNLLTLSRIAAIPPGGRLPVVRPRLDAMAAMSLFVIACVTDWFDGYFAAAIIRSRDLGRFLDPIADKLLVAATLLMLVYNGALHGIHVIAALVILMREILVLRPARIRRIASSYAGEPACQNGRPAPRWWPSPFCWCATPRRPIVTDTGLALIWIAAGLTFDHGLRLSEDGIAPHGRGPAEPRRCRVKVRLFRLDETPRRPRRGGGDAAFDRRHCSRSRRPAAHAQSRPCRGADRGRGVRRRCRSAHGAVRHADRRSPRSRVLFLLFTGGR